MFPSINSSNGIFLLIVTVPEIYLLVWYRPHCSCVMISTIMKCIWKHNLLFLSHTEQYWVLSLSHNLIVYSQRTLNISLPSHCTRFEVFSSILPMECSSNGQSIFFSRRYRPFICHTLTHIQPLNITFIITNNAALSCFQWQQQVVTRESRQVCNFHKNWFKAENEDYSVI